MNSAANRVCTLATLLAAIASLCACHGQDKKRDDPMFRTWEQNRWSVLYKLVDANGDGQVTREEFQLHYVPITWTYFDKNGDGFITVAEWSLDGSGLRRMEWFQQLDVNGDQVITRKEFEGAVTPAGTDRFFDLMDKDKNGTITFQDLETS